MQAAKQMANQAMGNVGPTPVGKLQENPWGGGPKLPGQPAMEDVGKTWTAEIWKTLSDAFDAMSSGNMGLDLIQSVDPKLILHPTQVACGGPQLN